VGAAVTHPEDWQRAGAVQLTGRALAHLVLELRPIQPGRFARAVSGGSECSVEVRRRWLWHRGNLYRRVNHDCRGRSHLQWQAATLPDVDIEGFEIFQAAVHGWH
jgi:hypothetical protein